jgi:hypothetical protein
MSSSEAKKDFAEEDFRQLLDTGRSLWPTYFQLAAMTFAWNASLGAGATFLNIRYLLDRPVDKDVLLMPVVFILVISFIGVVYNLGALRAYILMDRVHQEIISTLTPEHFPDYIFQSQIAKLLRGYKKEDRRVRPVFVLTKIFFIILSVSWVIFPLVAIVL